jgi:phosphoadenosine phosphosulfate reductase
MPDVRPLSEKLAATRAFLDGLLELARPEETAVAFTGGKDSSLVLWLWRECLKRNGRAPLRAVSVDTGLKFPETLRFRDRLAAQLQAELTVARPDVDLAAYPVARDPVACCRELKIAPLKRVLASAGVRLLLSGVRRDEHESRRDRQAIEPREDPRHVLANPILDWREMDVWAFTAEAGLPYCPLYGQGYRSLGCRPCTHRPGQADFERAGRNPDKERNLALLHGLGYF